MANTNMTKREVLNAIVEFINSGGKITMSIPSLNEETAVDPVIINENVLAYALNEINLLDKKAASAKNVQSKLQEKNEGIKEVIFTVLTENNKPITVGELIKDAKLIELDVSNQKASALLSQMIKGGRVFKKTDKKKSYFSITPFEEENSAEN